jgi:DNA-binding PadR family transcriptional regulator
MKPAWFHILLALADGDRHGFAIRESVKERTQGGVTLWPATLYGSIRDLAALGAIEPLDGDADPDQRRRYYRLTAEGREMLRREAGRLQTLVNAARGAGVLGRA